MLKALIVDDKLVTLQGLKKLIPWDELNAQVVGEAQNGEDALKLAMKLNPDIIISDIRMPVMDGLELCKQLHSVLPNAIKILLTAYSDFSYAQTAIKYGVTDYILKPINHQKIEQIINKIKDISSTKKQINAFLNYMYNSNLREELSTALQVGDIDIVENFFNNELNRIDKYNDTLVKEWGIVLFDVYYEVIEKIKGLVPDELIASKDYKWSKLLSIESKYEIKILIRDLYIQTVNYIYNVKNSRNNANIEFIDKYINENYHDSNMSVMSISDRLGLTPNYISNIFRQATGGNISKYITELRLKKAKELLCDPSIMVTDIALKVGYNDPRYFTKIFKKNEGLTPSEYRNALLQHLKREI